ncbi:PREDICTED: DMR6-LIKE OXYGENASE [Prunus dulcis]|uniref:PREDICTED: DMR6-LIKE OXYGENASE n=1 Tax=Prunus dulcis TaxID=3755 RepID=A0A5E4G3R5_PRUDU|nr:PREDICTED: DMR6-LIKE OXYGENASE [Prunus dulcis]
MTGTEATPQLLTQTCFGHESCYVQTPVIDYSMLISNDSLKTLKLSMTSIKLASTMASSLYTYLFLLPFKKWISLLESFNNVPPSKVTNHGIPDSLIGSVTSWLSRFFHRTDEEKRRYATNDPTDRIRFILGGVTKRELLHMRTHPTAQQCQTIPCKPPSILNAIIGYA